MGVVVLLLGTSPPAEAQLLKNLGDRAKAAAGRLAGAGEAPEETPEASGAEAPGPGALPPGMAALLGGGTAIPVEPEYAFDTTIRYDIGITGRDNRTEQLVYTLLYSSSAAYSGPQVETPGGRRADQDGVMIFDSGNRAMVMLSGSGQDRQTVVVPLPMLEGMAGNPDDVPEGTAGDESGLAGGMPATESLGTRSIAGLTARGYRFRHQGSTVEAWMTDDLPPGLGSALAAARSTPLLGQLLPGQLPRGLLLQLDSRDAGRGESLSMVAREIDRNQVRRFRLADYPRQ